MAVWRRLARRLGVALNLRDPPNVPPYGWSYFDHLVAVYVTLNCADERADTVIKKSRERAEDLTWGDVFLLENIVFSLQPPDVVDRNAWIIRERFREISCPSVYEKYTNSHPPVDSDTPEKLALLKADMTRVLDILHWYYSLIPIRERIRKSLTISCLLLVLLYTFLLGGILYWCNSYHASFVATMICVVYCGTIGGFVSSQRRMQSIPTEGDPLISVFGLDNAGYYLWLSPLLGAIFAVLLALMFIGGILKGTIFPEFVSSTGKAGLPFFDFTWNTLPKISDDYGKLFVWTFIAGFAERLVPDSIDRLTSKFGESAQPTAPKLPPKTMSVPVPAGGMQGQGQKGSITTETLQDVMHSGEIPPDPSKGDHDGR
jgi:hypothetical protein